MNKVMSLEKNNLLICAVGFVFLAISGCNGSSSGKNLGQVLKPIPHSHQLLDKVPEGGTSNRPAPIEKKSKEGPNLLYMKFDEIDRLVDEQIEHNTDCVNDLFYNYNVEIIFPSNEVISEERYRAECIILSTVAVLVETFSSHPDRGVKRQVEIYETDVTFGGPHTRYYFRENKVILPLSLLYLDEKDLLAHELTHLLFHTPEMIKRLHDVFIEGAAEYVKHLVKLPMSESEIFKDILANFSKQTAFTAGKMIGQNPSKTSFSFSDDSYANTLYQYATILFFMEGNRKELFQNLYSIEYKCSHQQVWLASSGCVNQNFALGSLDSTLKSYYKK